MCRCGIQRTFSCINCVTVRCVYRRFPVCEPIQSDGARLSSLTFSVDFSWSRPLSFLKRADISCAIRHRPCEKFTRKPTRPQICAVAYYYYRPIVDDSVGERLQIIRWSKLMIKFDDSKIISTEGTVNLLADRISYRAMHRETQCRRGIQYRYNFAVQFGEFTLLIMQRTRSWDPAIECTLRLNAHYRCDVIC